ncbi:MAG: hypothetical protein E6K53_05785, partial [Gammaproteobacteria bacterium]
MAPGGTTSCAPLVTPYLVTGPGHVPAQTGFPLRLDWSNLASPSGRNYGAIMVDGAAGLNGQTALVPFAFTRNGTNNDVADALEPDATRSIVLDPGESSRHMFVDGSPNYMSYMVNTTISGGSASFYAARTQPPAASASAQIAAAPPVSEAGTTRALSWYTYLEDGTPVWYQAQGPIDPLVWTAPLLRVNWDGAKVNTRAMVGNVVVTPLGNDELMFSWHLDGQSGSERFARLGAGPCPSINGTPTNFNGAWYAPTQSGY